MQKKVAKGRCEVCEKEERAVNYGRKKLEKAKVQKYESPKVRKVRTFWSFVDSLNRIAQRCTFFNRSFFTSRINSALCGPE
jgi:hypothetical protein